MVVYEIFAYIENEEIRTILKEIILNSPNYNSKVIIVENIKN